MDKSRVCINSAKQMARPRACVKKTNVLVYEKGKTDHTHDAKTSQYIIPPIANVTAKKIRVCTGAELRKMCAPKLCECPQLEERRKGFFGRILQLIGFGIKLVIAGGLIYWTYDMGLWGDSHKTEEIYLGLCDNISPLLCSFREEPRSRKISEICEKEIELMCKQPARDMDGNCRKAPSAELATHNIKETWNRLVVRTFDVLTDLPAYAKAAYNKIKSLTSPDPCDDEDAENEKSTKQ